MKIEEIALTELKELYWLACRYARRGDYLDRRPDLFTLSRSDLEYEVRRLQSLVDRLAVTLTNELAKDLDAVDNWKGENI